LLQKEDLTRAEAQIISQNDNEENKENNPSETAVLSATVNRLNIDLQECRQIITKKDSEISRLQVQYNESVRQLETLVSFARKYCHTVKLQSRGHFTLILGYEFCSFLKSLL
jgi:predicted RNase H-like nuclease (RuvC/YqgF family)